SFCLNVSSRRMAAPVWQHAFSFCLRPQCGGPFRTLTISCDLLPGRILRGHAPHLSERGFSCTQHRGQRRYRRHSGSLFCHFSESAHCHADSLTFFLLEGGHTCAADSRILVHHPILHWVSDGGDPVRH